MGKWALDFRRRYVCSGSCSVGSFVTVLELTLAKLRMCRVDITNDGEERASEGHWSRDWLGGFMWVQCEDDISNEIAACCYFSEELMWFWGTIAEYAAVGHFTAEDAGVDMKMVGILRKQGLLVDTEANLLHALKTVNADREQRMQGVWATRRIASADKKNTEVVAACNPSGDGRKASIPAESNGRKSSLGVVVKKEDTSDSDSSTSDGGMNEEKPGASVVKKEDTSGSYSSSGDALFYFTIGSNKAEVLMKKSHRIRVAGTAKNKWLNDDLMEYGLSRLDAEALTLTGGAVHITSATFFHKLMLEYNAWSTSAWESDKVCGFDMI